MPLGCVGRFIDSILARGASHRHGDLLAGSERPARNTRNRTRRERRSARASWFNSAGRSWRACVFLERLRPKSRCAAGFPKVVMVDLNHNQAEQAAQGGTLRNWVSSE